MMASNDKNIRELYIGIGSNLNDPLQQVNNAIEKISNLFWPILMANTF